MERRVYEGAISRCELYRGESWRLADELREAKEHIEELEKELKEANDFRDQILGSSKEQLMQNEQVRLLSAQLEEMVAEKSELEHELSEAQLENETMSSATAGAAAALHRIALAAGFKVTPNDHYDVLAALAREVERLKASEADLKAKFRAICEAVGG